MGPTALPETGYAAKVALADLPAGQHVFYRVTFQDLGDLKTRSAPVSGRFKTAPADFRDVTFVWSGDTAGQGWGINVDWGGMKLYEVMRRTEPDFFVHSGDMIYADGPDRRRGAAAVGRRVEEPGDRGEGQGRGDARGVPGQLQVQPPRRARAPLQRRRRPVRPVGRPRGDQQLVHGADPGRRALYRQELRSSRCPRQASHVRLHPAGGAPAGVGAGVPGGAAGAAARSLHARHAELSRAEQREPAAGAGR